VKPKRVTIVVWGAGGPSMRILPLQHGVSLDVKSTWGLFITGTAPAFIERGRKFLRFAGAKLRAFVGAFEDDGEAIDFKAGPMNDWRSDESDPEDRLESLFEMAGDEALVEATDPGKQGGGSIGMRWMLMTQAVIGTVLLIFVISYFQKGGLPL